MFYSIYIIISLDLIFNNSLNYTLKFLILVISINYLQFFILNLCFEEFIKLKLIKN